jgi:nucleoside-diphosphate-sugar epimerase
VLTTLVTGGAGFIATRLARLLEQAGHKVLLFDRTSKPGVQPLEVTDRPAVFEALEGVDGVVHLAAVLSGQSELDPALAFDVNLLGTFNVLEGARRAGVQKVVATSSIAAIERPNPSEPVDESAATSPLGVYGMSKISMESWCQFYRRRWGMDVRVGRPGAVVGPGREAGGASSNFTTAIIQEPLLGRPYVCPVAEDDSSPLVYQSDLVDGLAKLYLAESVTSPVYNLGACSATARQLADLVRDRIPAARVTFEPDDVARFVVGRWKHVVQDNALAARDLGYSPKYDTPAKLVDAFIEESRRA